MPKPGDRDYRGPVHEGWGRTLQGHIDNANQLGSDIQTNIGGLEQGVRSGVQSGLDTIAGIFNQPAQGSTNPTKTTVPDASPHPRDDISGGGAGGSF